MDRTVKQTIIKNTLWLSVGHTVSKALRAAIVILAARALGVLEYGYFSYGLAVAGLFIAYSDFGLTQFITRESARNPQERAKYLATSLILKFILITIGALIIYNLAPIISKTKITASLFPIITLLFALDTLSDFLIGVVRSLEDMMSEALIIISTSVAFLILGTVCLIFYPTSIALLIVYTIASALGVCLLSWHLRKEFRQIFSNIYPQLIGGILKQAWPLGLATAISSIMLSIDSVMIGWMRDIREVAWYAAAQRILVILYFIPGFLNVSVFPALARFANEDSLHFRTMLTKILHASLLLAVPITLFGAFYAKEIIHILFGDQYAKAALPFTLLIANTLLVFPNIFLANALFANNMQRVILASLFTGMIINIAINSALIPRFGPAGAATATLISQSAVTIINYRAIKKQSGLRILNRLGQCLSAALISFIFLISARFFDFSFFLALPAFFILYFGALLLLKEPLIKELRETYL